MLRQNMTTACAFCAKLECFPPFFDPLLFRRHDYRLTSRFFDILALTVLGMTNWSQKDGQQFRTLKRVKPRSNYFDPEEVVGFQTLTWKWSRGGKNKAHQSRYGHLKTLLSFMFGPIWVLGVIFLVPRLVTKTGPVRRQFFLHNLVLELPVLCFLRLYLPI
jgi:hypothetical protein